jgi:hypothetical protein
VRDRIKALVKICRLRAKVNRQVSRKCQHVTFSSRSQNFWFWPAVPFASRPAALTTVSIVADSASGRKCGPHWAAESDWVTALMRQTI